MIVRLHPIALAALISSSALVACDKPGGAAASTSSSSSSSDGVTMATFSKVKTGMTYAEVKTILGSDGTEMSSSELAGIKTVMYKWDGSEFASNVTATFQNGKLTSKAQFGLK